MATKSALLSLQQEFDSIQKSLKDVDENIKKITGREPDDFRNGPPGPPRRFQGNAENRPRNAPWNGDGGGGGGPRRRFLQGPNMPFPKRMRMEREESPEEDELPNKPNLPSTVVAATRQTKTRRDTIEQQKKDKGFERNRRMFGLILGTLQKFQHEHSTSKDKLSKRQEIEKKVEEAAEKEKQQIRKERQELFLARKEKRSRIRCLEHKLELARTYEYWEESRKKMANFIQTSTQPPLFYLPAKMTPTTHKLLRESRLKIEEEISRKRQELEEKLQEVDQWYSTSPATTMGYQEECSQVPPENSSVEHAAEDHPNGGDESGWQEQGPMDITPAIKAEDIAPPEEDNSLDTLHIKEEKSREKEDSKPVQANMADQEFEPIYE